MRILRCLLIISSIAILALVAMLAYMGVFSTVKVVEKEVGPYTLVVERYAGEYKDTGKIFEKVYKAVKNEGIQTTRGIGIFYDDPKSVAKDKLRSDCGVILEGKDLDKVPALRKKKFNIMTIRKKKSMVAEFPLVNTFSYMIGPAKGYPALMKHMQEKGYKMSAPYEIYDMRGGNILYVMEIVK